jgi:hypothetical protein
MTTKKKTKKSPPSKLDPNTSHPEEQNIQELRGKLQHLRTSWLEDGSYPPNHIRRDGLGNVIAEVNVWCGGYQEPHKPKMVGWKTKITNRSLTGAVMVGRRPRSEAVARAMEEADEALESMWNQGFRNYAELQG